MSGLNRAYKRRPSMVSMNGGPVLCLDAGSKLSYPGTGTTWTDLSGNGNNGTLTNGPTFDSANNGSLVFNGTNQYATLNGSLAGNTSFTFVAWFKSTSIATEQNIYDSGFYTPSASNPSGFLVEIYQSKLNYQVGNSWVQSTTTLLNNAVYCAAIVKPYGSAGTFYVNGISAGSTVNTDVTMAIGSARIGTQLPNLTQFFKGNLYTIQIYNRALSATEISTNFNLLRGRYGI